MLLNGLSIRTVFKAKEWLVLDSVNRHSLAAENQNSLTKITLTKTKLLVPVI